MLPPPIAIRVATEWLAARARWHPLEIVFWLVAFAAIYLFPESHLILTEIAWLGLFALSLDLILGYAGIISLGHAAFFGFGAYTAALLAKHEIINEPVLALLVSGLVAMALGFVTSFLVLRGSDLTRLMVTLGVALVLRELANQIRLAHRRRRRAAGRHHQADVRDVPFRYVWPHRLRLLPDRAVHPVPDCASPGEFALRSFAHVGERQSAALIGDRNLGRCPPDRDLHRRRRLCRHRRRTAGADDGFRLARSVSFDRSADLLLVLIIGGAGYLYGGLIGAIIFKFMQDYLSVLTPQYWPFWIGLVLVVIVLVGRERITIVDDAHPPHRRASGLAALTRRIGRLVDEGH